MWGHPDQLEGPASFAEKREPVWVAPVGAVGMSAASAGDRASASEPGADGARGRSPREISEGAS